MKGLILTYVLASLAGISALRYPAIGVMAYAGFGILRPHFIFGFAGQITDISFWLGLATLAGWAFTGFGTWRMGRARGTVLALAAYGIWTVLSATLALDQTQAYTSLIPLAKLVLPVIIGLTVLNDGRTLRWVFWTIVLSQAYVGFEMNLVYPKGFNQAAEGFGGMDNNFFAASLVSTIGPAIALSLLSKTWYERGAAYAATALILHTTLLTFSRGAMVGMLAMGAVALVMIPKSPRFLAVTLVVGLLAVRLTGPQLIARYATAFASVDERDRSAESRVDLWIDCLKVVQEYPMLGVGPANWRVIAASYGWSEGKSAHSVWMESAAEIGVPGVMALLLFFILPAVKLWPVARAKLTDENRYEVAIATGVVLCVVGFVVAGQFISAPSLEPPYYVVMVGASLLKSRRNAVADKSVAPLGRLPHPSLSPFAPAVERSKTQPPGAQPAARREV